MKQRLLTAFILLFAGMIALAVPGVTPAGTFITNTASASYDDSAGSPQTSTSNEVTTEVLPVYGFSITPSGTEASPGQTHYEFEGQLVYFTYTLTNNANETDTIELLASNLTGTDDFDLTDLKIYHDVNEDGILDANDVEVSSIADMAQNESVKLIVTGRIPAGTPAGQFANIDLTGTSTKDPTVTDEGNVAQVIVLANAAVTAVKTAGDSVLPGGTITYSVAGEHNGANGAFAVEGVVTVDSTPRDGIFVSDVFPTALTYTQGSLTGSSTAGTAVPVYSTDEGSTWTETQPASGVTAVGLLIEGSGQFFGNGATYSMSFEVTAPADATSGVEYANTAALRFDANGDGDGNDLGENITTPPTTTTVSEVSSITFEGDKSGSVVSPGNVTYTHTITNTGNDTATISIPAHSSPHSGWTYEYSTDGGNTFATSVSNLEILQGEDHEVQVRVNVLAGALNGTSESATITATASFPSSATGTDSVTDTTTVVIGVLELDKAVDENSAKPGDELVYTITAANTGSANLTNLIVSDPLPVNTEFVALSATKTNFPGAILYSTNSTSWSTTAPTSLADGGTVYVGVNTDSDNNITSADVMPAGAELVITFTVKIK